MKFTVIERDEIKKLINVVNKHLKDGWVLAGPFTANRQDTITEFYQPMTKAEGLPPYPTTIGLPTKF